MRVPGRAAGVREAWRFWSLPWSRLALWAAALALCLGVLALNRGPLLYYDSGSYIRQGNVALNILLPPPAAEASGPGQAAGADRDGTASGSRSVVYALLSAAAFRAGAPALLALLQLGAVLLAAVLAARAAARLLPGLAPGPLAAGPLLAAGAASLPFYIAYLMPDIFAPLLLMMIALLVAFGPALPRADLLLASGLALLAVLAHPSHMAIAGLMLPFVLLAALLPRGAGQGKRRWLALAVLAAVVAAAVAERRAFAVAAKSVAGKEVTYTPHITARLIVDGPGLTYLEEACPDPAIATCALYEALSWSDDPYRLTASHIIFSRDPRLGSFRLMEPEAQRRVALAQRGFFFDVLRSQPGATLLALAGNSYRQLLRDSIWMTVPTEEMMENARRMSRLEEPEVEMIRGGALAAERSWIGLVDRLHGAVYALSFAGILVLLLWPGRVPPQMKLFVLFILAGLCVNAFVCGAISQPADRYGARVMWLLPFTAAWLALAAWHGPGAHRTKEGTGG
ncbi:hypothetical protein ACUXV3_20270 (plasmid) [Roseobacteraceae bacterium NS-SX3]